VLAKLRLPETAQLVRGRRLKLLAAIIRPGAPAPLKALLRATAGTSTGEVRLQDLRWLRTQCKKLTHLPDPAVAPAVWETLMRDRDLWAGCVDEALLVAAKQLEQAEQERAQSGPPAGSEPDAPPKWLGPAQWEALEDAEPGAYFRCGFCPPARARCCRTHGALRSHEQRAHGVGCPVRPYVTSSRCPACGLEYHTRLRALHHARYSSPVCRRRILAGELPRPPPCELHAADEADRPALRTAARAGTSACLAAVPGPRPGRRRISGERDGGPLTSPGAASSCTTPAV